MKREIATRFGLLAAGMAGLITSACAARGGAGLCDVLSERGGFGAARRGGFAAWDFDFAFSHDQYFRGDIGIDVPAAECGAVSVSDAHIRNFSGTSQNRGFRG